MRLSWPQVYLGCNILDGNGLGVVVNTGMQTCVPAIASRVSLAVSTWFFAFARQMGQIWYLLKTTDKDDTPLHKKLHGLGQLVLNSLFLALSLCLSALSLLVPVPAAGR